MSYKSIEIASRFQVHSCRSTCAAGLGYASTFNPSHNGLRDFLSFDPGMAHLVKDRLDDSSVFMRSESSAEPERLSAVSLGSTAACKPLHACREFMQFLDHAAGSGTVGSRSFSSAGTPFTLPAIQAAGSAAAVLQIAVCQPTAKSTGTSVPDGTLAAVLSAVVSLCPAASCMLTCHATRHSQMHAAAAAAAAAACCRFASALLQLKKLSPGDMKAALASVKARTAMDVAVALACVLRQGCLVPPALHTEAAHLVAALLAAPELAAPVLRSWVGEGEWLCPWPQPGATHATKSTKGSLTVPVGSSLLDGLMPECSDAQSPPVLGALPLPASSMQSTSAVGQDGSSSGLTSVHWAAVQCLLAHSAEAKERAAARALHLYWVQRAIQGLNDLCKDQDQVFSRSLCGPCMLLWGHTFG